MRDDAIKVSFTVRRRTAWVTGAIVAVLVGVAAWWVASGTATVTTGAFSSAGGGHTDQCPYPDEDFWAVYAKDEARVAVQTIRNDSPWSVEVISSRPEAFRFGRVAADPLEDYALPDPADGEPPADETSDRVVIPPEREVAMWIVEPFRTEGKQPTISDGRAGISEADVQIRSLGIVHGSHIEFGKSLWLSGLRSDSKEFQRELAALCEV